MTITNGYTTLTDFKNFARITSTDTTDDAVLETLIESTSRLIDSQTGRQFYGTSTARSFDLPTSQELMFDIDCQTVTSITNGDGTVFAASDYVLLPSNNTPKFGVQLKAPNIWLPDSNGNALQVISVAGTFGLATPPADIVYACKVIAHAAYKRRFGENVSSISTITGAGVVVEPQDIPGGAFLILLNNRRITFG